MTFYIYIIINKINNKFYIGKTTTSINRRFKRHINDALTGRLHTPLANAIRKYGADNFQVEELDTATTQEDLNQKEIYWIETLKAVQHGYNAALGGEGGNTYSLKTKEEMEVIKTKIRETKLGSKNPHSVPVKCKDVLTGQELFFPTIASCQEHFGEANHNFITRRCSGKTKYVYARKWIFAYKNKEYIDDYQLEKDIKRKRRVKIVNVKDNTENTFNSYAAAEVHFGFKRGFFSGDAHKHKNKPYWEKAGYRIYVLE